jgi:hypothetical protein
MNGGDNDISLFSNNIPNNLNSNQGAIEEVVQAWNDDSGEPGMISNTDNSLLDML